MTNMSVSDPTTTTVNWDDVDLWRAGSIISVSASEKSLLHDDASILQKRCQCFDQTHLVTTVPKELTLLCVLLRWLGWDRPSMSIEHNSYTRVVSAEYVWLVCLTIPPGRSRAGFDEIARWFGLKTINSKISPVTELWRSPSPWIDTTLRLASYGAILASVGYRDAQT